MAGSKYTDTSSALQVIGCIYKQPSLLDDEGKYFFSEEDFTTEFHKIMFGTLYNLHQMGTTFFSNKIIEDYLKDKPKSYSVYKDSNGANWLKEQEEFADIANFEYYYSRLKKFTLLRQYDKFGLNIKWIYDPDEIFDAKRKEAQERQLDSLTLDEIATKIEEKINNIRREYIDNSLDNSYAIGENIFELIEELQKEPDAGPPMYGELINEITRGMRYGRLYIRSAASGVGKTRTMVADACNCACSKIFDTKKQEWVDNGLSFPSLYIATEQELDEIQTIALAFLSGVDEEHILTGQYNFGNEKERVLQAAKILQESPLYIEYIPDFTLRDIENCIKRHLRQNGVQFVFYDYVHTSMKMLEEISRRSGGIRLREDNLLFLLSVKLKDLCTQFGIFILTSTQLNQDWKTADIPDQNLLRGAKAIADKADVGMILLDVTDEDKEALEELVTQNGYMMPNVKLSIYKNRRGSYNKCYLWMNADKSTCRFNGLFCTAYNYYPIHIDRGKIEINLD